MKLFGYDDTLKNPVFITPWSLIHGYAGVIFYVAAKRFFPKLSLMQILIINLILHSIYEIKDMLCYHEELFIKIYGKKPAESYWGNNTFSNTIGDTIFSLVGSVLASVLFKKKATNELLATMILTYSAFWLFFERQQYG